MTSKGEVLHVVRHEDTWGVREENATKDIVQTHTQQEAIEYAREIARSQDADIMVHAADGTIRARLSAKGSRISEDYYLQDRIVISKDVAHSKPRVVGTRILVETILDLLAAGKPIEEITSEDYFPDLTREDVLACLIYARQVIQNEKYIPTEWGKLQLGALNQILE
jgi:uncharacterized protein (DUF433 family)